MDDSDDDARYPPNAFTANHHHHSRRSPFHSETRSRMPHRSAPYPLPPGRRYPKREEEVAESEEDEQRNYHGNEDVDGGDEEDSEASEYHNQNDDSSPDSRGKRRKLDKYALGFEFAPRVAARAPPTPAVASSRMPMKNNQSEWSQEETFVLLEACGELLKNSGRTSMRFEEWVDVAKKVNTMSRIPRSDSQCRNRLDTLKKKYKKEKYKQANTPGWSSDWVYFEKMDEIMDSPLPASVAKQQQQPRLPRGFDSGEFVFANTRPNLNRSNGYDEITDSPAGSELMSDSDDSDGLPPSNVRKSSGGPNSSSFRALVDSIEKLGTIFEKIENNKRQHMAELERMRRDFHKEIEVQKRQILERAQEELARIRQKDGTDKEDGEDGEEENNNDHEGVDGSAGYPSN